MMRDAVSARAKAKLPELMEAKLPSFLARGSMAALASCCVLASEARYAAGATRCGAPLQFQVRHVLAQCRVAATSVM